jgi:hypothetical protein
MYSVLAKDSALGAQETIRIPSTNALKKDLNIFILFSCKCDNG